MKFLFVTLFGESLSLMQILIDEGHKVKCFIKDRKFHDIGRGLIPRVQNWKAHLDWADIVVFDDVDFGKDIDYLRNRGYFVVGGNSFGDRLENDRLFGQKVLQETGIKIPASWRFRNFANALRFVEKNPKRYVLKFNGQLERHLCYLGRSKEGEDLVKIIEHYQETWPKNKKIDFILQEYIEGIEMGVGAFFNGTDFVRPINVTFEHKHFLVGGIGPFTGEMGTSMFYSEDGGKLFHETLSKIKPYLARTNYRGFIDINNIVTEKGAYAIEFTCRFGYPQLDIQQELHKTSWGELLFRLAQGSLEYFETYPDFAIGVVIGGAGMPFEISYNKYGRGLPIFGVTEKNKPHVKLAQVFTKDGKRFYCAAGGYPITVTGRGKTMETAKKKAYAVVNQIILPNSVYRIDIGDHWKKEAPKLRKWGYI